MPEPLRRPQPPVLGPRVCEQLCPAMRTSSGELPLTSFVAGPSTGRRHPHLLTQLPQVSRSSSRRRTTLAVSTSPMLGCTGGRSSSPARSSCVRTADTTTPISALIRRRLNPSRSTHSQNTWRESQARDTRGWHALCGLLSRTGLCLVHAAV